VVPTAAALIGVPSWAQQAGADRIRRALDGFGRPIERVAGRGDMAAAGAPGETVNRPV